MKTETILGFVFSLGVAIVAIVAVVCAKLNVVLTTLLVSMVVVTFVIAFMKDYKYILFCGDNRKHSDECKTVDDNSEKDSEPPDIPTRLREIDVKLENIKNETYRLGYKFGIALLQREMRNKCFFSMYKPSSKREEYEGIFDKYIFFRNADLVKDRLMVHFDNWSEFVHIWDMYYDNYGRLFFGATMVDHRFNFMFEVSDISRMRILKTEDLNYAMDITIKGDVRGYCTLVAEGIDRFEERVRHGECVRQMLAEYQDSLLILAEHKIGQEESKSKPKTRRTRKATKKSSTKSTKKRK